MPVYEYQCKSCEKRFTVLLRIMDGGAIQPCPRCGSEEVRKLISSVSIARSTSQKEEDRQKALLAVDPTKPQEVARYFQEHDSPFGDTDFRGTDTWHEIVERVAKGGSTLDE